MSKTTGLILAILVITIVVIAIGYADVSAQVIRIQGTLAASADVASNFLFRFKDAQADANNPTGITVTASASGTSANFSVSGLTKVGDTVSATYTIENASVNLNATDIKAAVTTGNNSKYFKTTVTGPAKTTLNTNGDTTSITVTTELIAAPLIDNLTEDVVIEISAMPVDINA